MSDDTSTTDSVMLTFSRKAGKPDFDVRAVEFKSANLLHRSLPDKGSTIEDVFCPELAVYLRQRFERIGPGRVMEVYPEDIITLDGATLGRTRVIANKNEQGGTLLMVRFAHCVGDMGALFAFETPMSRSVLGDGEVAMLRAIEAVHLPVINMADECVGRVLENEQRRVIEERLNMVSQEIQELRFYFHLLARHIANTDTRPTLRLSAERREQLTNDDGPSPWQASR